MSSILFTPFCADFIFIATQPIIRIAFKVIEKLFDIAGISNIVHRASKTGLEILTFLRTEFCKINRKNRVVFACCRKFCLGCFENFFNLFAELCVIGFIRITKIVIRAQYLGLILRQISQHIIASSAPEYLTKTLCACRNSLVPR